MDDPRWEHGLEPPLFSSTYDLVYEDWIDYEADARFVEAVHDRFAHGPIERVLDLGCGAGAHLEALGAPGRTCVGIDRAAPALESARERLGSQAHLVQADLRSIPLEWEADLAISMFASLGYVGDVAHIRTALAEIRSQLAPDGRLVAELWRRGHVQDGLTTEVEREHRGGNLRRYATHRVDPAGTHYRSTYTFELEAPDGRIVLKEIEGSSVRLFDPARVEALLAQAGLALDTILPGGGMMPERIDRRFGALDRDDGRFMVVARPTGEEDQA